ncbi:TonB-dependent receptor plug domain-containing protein [Hymenobacter swuensis]|uniref:TonB-dependent receptor plug domain-containing protein n=1 Tax=Hymenobacter swuensis DY53 TaxID=1227739 RepID=W8EV92_9BACT|nr:TonB-dependent receptor plug domain-containing protein [Hymenobacter swuensis]AHJ95652.1 hypothetical protein Hsw_0057 [Hymenobacter swuensis DY53]
MRILTSFRSTAFGTSLLLLLGIAAPAAQAQNALAAPAQASGPSLYFLDGQPSTQQAINQLNRRTIASVNVVKGPDATRIFGAGAADGVMVVVTKRNVGSEAVAEFNRRYDIRPVETPVPPARP